MQFRYGPAAVTGYEPHKIHCSYSLWEGVVSRTIRKSEDLPRISLATGFPGKVRRVLGTTLRRAGFISPADVREEIFAEIDVDGSLVMPLDAARKLPLRAALL